jgi:hypothetical protein
MDNLQEAEAHPLIVENALMQISKDLRLSIDDFTILDDSNRQLVQEYIEGMKRMDVYHISGRAITRGVELGWLRRANPLEPWDRISYIEYVFYDPKYKSGRITVKYREPFMDYLRIHDSGNEISPFGIPIETTHFRFLKGDRDNRGMVCFTLYDRRSDRDLDGDYSFKFFGWKPVIKE